MNYKDKDPGIETCELSSEAASARSEYFKLYRAEHPESIKAVRLRYWEKKAQEFYGVDYVGPKPGEELSSQARELRRKYYADYREKNSEAIKKSHKAYWERKAREL